MVAKARPPPHLFQDQVWFFQGFCGGQHPEVTAYDMTYTWDPNESTNRGDFDFGPGKRVIMQWKTGRNRCVLATGGVLPTCHSILP